MAQLPARQTGGRCACGAHPAREMPSACLQHHMPHLPLSASWRAFSHATASTACARIFACGAPFSLCRFMTRCLQLRCRLAPCPRARTAYRALPSCLTPHLPRKWCHFVMAPLGQVAARGASLDATLTASGAAASAVLYLPRLVVWAQLISAVHCPPVPRAEGRALRDASSVPSDIIPRLRRQLPAIHGSYQQHTRRACCL